MDLNEIRGLGSLVVRADAPCGDPVRDEPEFERLQTEVRKLELPDGIQPDWPVVADLSIGILRGKSKDLLPACFLSFALFRLQGYEGLGAGLEMLLQMVEHHWEGLYPDLKRIRGRFSAMEWLAHRSALEAGARTAASSDLSALESCREHLGRLGETLEQKAEGGWGIFGEMRSAFEEASRRTPSPPEEAPAPAPGPAIGSPAAGSVAAVAPSAPPFGGAITNESEATQALESIRGAGYRLADFLRATDPRNPLGYRLPRMMAWLSLRDAPPSTDGMTGVPGYQPPDLGQRLREASERGQWMGVLEQTEGRIAGAVLWLDLHRFAWQALDALGAEFVPAAEAVAGELAGLLRRLPGLDGLKFANGVPLADEATRLWIRERVTPSSAGDGPVALSTTGEAHFPVESADTEEFDRVRAEARALVRQKKLREALQLLQDGAAASRALRGRIQWGLEIGRICQEARSPETAYLHLRGLYDEVSRAGMEDWDPVSALELTKTLLLSLDDVLSSGQPRPEDDRAFHRELKRRLCRLDIASALASEGRR